MSWLLDHSPRWEGVVETPGCLPQKVSCGLAGKKSTTKSLWFWSSYCTRDVLSSADSTNNSNTQTQHTKAKEPRSREPNNHKGETINGRVTNLFPSCRPNGPRHPRHRPNAAGGSRSGVSDSPNRSPRSPVTPVPVTGDAIPSATATLNKRRTGGGLM